MNSISLSGIYNSINLETWEKIGPILVIIAVVIFIIALVENSRIPFDDPNTHLELTMIHEVMVLDHGGVDFAFILYSGALKIWIFISLLAGILIPLDTGFAGLNVILYFFTMIFLSIMIGIIESFMARLLLIKVTRVVIGVLALSVLTLIFQLR
ncbi:MAG: Ech-hydrogenase-like complex NuoH-like protein integral membrane subunit [uncultured bacterium]|nr:MAG: Ech-hydrogenase-like complex NuoH-like protein integral membrane subunit [uncultured bacterium]